MRTLLFLGLVLVMTVPARSENNVMGYGVNSCATFGQGYKKHQELVEELYYAWARGFMSGMNIAAHGSGLRSKNIAASSEDEQKRFIRDWCNDYPLSGYYDAVV
jgi:hypothetical protein